MMRRDFADVLMWGQSPNLAQGLPILFVANHLSWWDGFFLWRIQRKIAPGAPVYTVMLAREFHQTFWFKWVGMLPITPGSTASLRALLKRLHSFCKNPQRSPVFCSFFPQGVIKPSFARPLGFADGLGSIAQAMAPVNVVPIGIHVEPLCARHPKAFLAVGESFVHESGRLNVEEVEQSLTKTLDDLLFRLAKHGEKILENGLEEGVTYVSVI
jgi:1-acyl-sn-glycerol-3-phosphate acyltransferase